MWYTDILSPGVSSDSPISKGDALLTDPHRFLLWYYAQRNKVIHQLEKERQIMDASITVCDLVVNANEEFYSFGEYKLFGMSDYSCLDRLMQHIQ